VVEWIAEAKDPAVKRVTFGVDGVKVAIEQHLPYRTSFDTRKLADGQHTFTVTADGAQGARTSVSALVKVANDAPPPAPQSVPFTASQNVASGQTLSGSVSWTVSPAGKPVDRVEFFVDGQLSWTERLAPYVYAGDGGMLDTRLLQDGAHVLSVKAYATDGSTASASASVSISNSSSGGSTGGSGLTLTSSIKDATTITGSVSWTITPSGKSVSRMDFYIDAQLKWTERLSPWVYGGDDKKLDTSTLAKGQHTLTVKAYATDGTVAVLTLKVTVA
jgi:hypothetical protein